MSISSKYIVVASMDVKPEFEALFNEVYDTEHVPYLMEVPGVHSVTRIKSEAFVLAMGGEEIAKPAASPVYSAVYEIDGPEVLKSKEWAEAIERGRWSKEVRPHTHNKSHTMYRVM